MKAAEKAKQHKDTLAGSIRWVMETRQGRYFMRWMLDELGRLTSPSYTPGDSLGTAYLEGKRAAAIELLKQLKGADPRGYVEMLNEWLIADEIQKAIDVEEASSERDE